MRAPLYEVWFSTGTGTHIGPKFRLLDDAIRYVHDHADEASYAVRSPTGDWALIEARHRRTAARGDHDMGADPVTARRERARTRPRIARGTSSPK